MKPAAVQQRIDKVLAALPPSYTGKVTVVLHVHRGSVGRVEVKR